MPPPIPIVGDSRQVSVLIGSWSGEYSSWMTGRHGVIQFALAAESDTAYGDVLMLPRAPRSSAGNADRISSPRLESPLAIPVGFVLAAHDSVFGVLEPYQDPVSGRTLITRFAGRLRGDRIEGAYVTHDTGTDETTSGEWNVRRLRSER